MEEGEADMINLAAAVWVYARVGGANVQQGMCDPSLGPGRGAGLQGSVDPQEGAGLLMESGGRSREGECLCCGRGGEAAVMVRSALAPF